MKKPLLLIIPALASLGLTQCQTSKPTATAGTSSSTPAAATPAPQQKEYKYQTVEGDPLKARIYTLDNGLTVYLSDYDDAPRIQTYLAVRAGSKNDPSTATGLAHYLEHMVFKGTSRLGTQNWAAEKVELDKIEALYEQYRAQRNDPAARKRTYHQIDSISSVAAKYAVANEYDKVMGAIGAKGSNAYTSVEQTVYQEDIPSNQLEKWAAIQAERMGEMVPRLFHTELEAVYEEKNRGLDSDFRKEFEAMNASLFQKHEYGTQTTIGTIEHLQNPSITEIKKYFGQYYVPNNVALCLSGDLDYDQTIRIIDQYFGKLQAKPVPAFTPAQEAPITAPIVKEVLGPDAENVMIGFRFPGTATRDALVLRMIDKILSNGQAGLIDLDLNQKQAVLSAASFTDLNNDYSTHILYATPRQGQSLNQVRDLLLGELSKVKQGDFPEWLIPAIINNEQLQRTKSYESNEARAGAFVAAFVAREDWKDYLKQFDDFGTITKEEVMRVAKQYYGPGYALVYKRTGQDPNKVKVVKPAITPVPVNREAASDFYKQVTSMTSPELQPVFLDYKKDIQETKLASGLPVYYTHNAENNLFNLYYVLDLGTNHDPKLGLATDYLQYLGTGKYNAAQLQQEFYKLGCSFSVQSGQDRTFVSLSGLDTNFEQALQLFESLLAAPKPDAAALKNMVAGVLKARQDAKLNKGVILNQALVNYAKYGAKNPFTTQLSEKELKALKPEQLTALIQKLPTYQHRVLYYGPRPMRGLKKTDNEETEKKIGYNNQKDEWGSPGSLTNILTQHHRTPAKLTPVPANKDFAEQPLTDRKVYWVDYNMVQAEILFLSKGPVFDKGLLPTTSLYNEYFGGSMGSIVFQELRESKALAYSASSRFASADKVGRSSYNLSYIGTQSDKLPEAMAGMNTLLNDMPVAEANLQIAKQSIRNSIATERITKSDILFSYERAKRLGLDYDVRRDVYEQTANMSFQDLQKFQQARVKGQPQTILVIGSKDRLNFKELAKYGQVQQLTLKEIFGY
ncbi:putative Zn-dependent peptidase [Hymenobacter luteus]|uniref:Zn-dependent peptidase n=2 Tax=Hymenobacter TaxID=89966 RepID=A0ABR6K0Z2_9BACT|nr:insulinase family protein [Hymenobacter latericoloratus]MBB4602651.1 putative Zn-dependent peptidase [Hymenobacter latericoloratus]MBB6060542.1 putative Zn-dependent peptidase [Hymenobacter luteus]